MAVRPPAYSAVADHLLEMILAGVFPIGQRLPTEATLSVQFGVSRSTVREALRMLSSLRLVATSRGVAGGTVVSRVDAEDVSKLLRMGIGQLAQAEQCSIDELLEARELLEVPAARLAAQCGNTSLIAQLAAAVPRSLASVDPKGMFEINRAFHRVILQASGNRLLPIITEPIFHVIQTRLLRDRATPEFWSGVNSHHGAILAAIVRGDSIAAAERMTEHLRELSATYRRMDSLTIPRGDE
jgi:GntR family transcriptional repressor for pyruvate dehydrogenase complex